MPERQPLTDMDMPEGQDKEIKAPTPTKEETEQQKAVKRGRDKIHALESSSISGDLKELMNGWLEQNLSGESLNAYVDKVRENPKLISIGSMVEGISETLLDRDEDLKKQFDEGKVSVMQLADTVFDTVFVAAREAMPTAKYDELLEGFKKATRLPSNNEEGAVGSRDGMEELSPMPNMRDVVQGKLSQLESSEFSDQMRELMNGWLEQHLSGDALKSYAADIKADPDKFTLPILFEGMMETVLSENQELNERFQKGEVNIGQLSDAVFDTLFSSAQEGMKTEDYQKLLNGFKGVMASDPQEEKPQERASGMEELTPMPNMKDVVQGKLSQLESSEFSDQMRELMNGWLEQHLSGDALKSYAADIKANPDKFTLPILFEGMLETVLSENQELNGRFQKGEVNIGQISDAVFDTLFSEARESMKADDYQKLLKGVQGVMAQ